MKDSLPRVLAAIVAAFSISCSKSNQISEEYMKSEIERVERQTKEVLDHLGMKDYKLFIIPHKILSKPQISKKYDNEYFNGAHFTPEWEKGQNKVNIPPIYKEIEYQAALYRKMSGTIQYEEKGSESLNFDHLGVLIVFDRFEQSQLVFLQGAMEGTVLNTQRGDEIRIIRKQDWAKTQKQPAP